MLALYKLFPNKQNLPVPLTTYTFLYFTIILHLSVLVTTIIIWHALD